MCFGLSTLDAWAKTRLESRINQCTPHCICFCICRQAVEMKKLDKVMGSSGAKVISEAKSELFREDKEAGRPRRESAVAWSTMAQQYNKDIVHVSVNAKKDRIQSQQDEMQTLVRQLEVEFTEAEKQRERARDQLDWNHNENLVRLKTLENKGDASLVPDWQASLGEKFVAIGQELFLVYTLDC